MADLLIGHYRIVKRRERLEAVSILEQADTQVGGGINLFTVNRYAAVSDAHDQLALDHTLQVDAVGDLFGGWQDLTGKFHFATTQGATAAFVAFPAQEEAYELPHGVKAQAAWHYWVGREVAVKEPQVRMDIQFGDDLTFAELTAFVADMGDTVEHQHIVYWQAGIAFAKHLAVTAVLQVFEGVGVLLLR